MTRSWLELLRHLAVEADLVALRKVEFARVTMAGIHGGGDVPGARQSPIAWTDTILAADSASAWALSASYSSSFGNREVIETTDDAGSVDRRAL
jgi:hypothetical protein